MFALVSALPALFIAKIFGSNVLGNFHFVMLTLYLPSGLIGSAIGQVFIKFGRRGKILLPFGTQL